MKEPIRTMPYDNTYRDAYPSVPEFIGGTTDSKIYIRQGTFEITHSYKTLASEGFSACSGMVLRDESRKVFGLLHALPIQDLYPEDFERLKVLAGGQLVVVEGSRSVPNTGILRGLSQKLGIEQVDRLVLDTVLTNSRNMHFHLAFRPAENELLVARNSHKDLLTFTAF